MNMTLVSPPVRSAEHLYHSGRVGDVIAVTASGQASNKILAFQREVLEVSDLAKNNKINVLAQKTRWHDGFNYPVYLKFIKLR